MNPTPPRLRVSKNSGCALALLACLPALAQVPSPLKAGGDETVTLTPFEVRTDTDVGYTATNSLMGGRINTALKDTPAAISVITRQFMDDILATDPGSVVEWAVNMAPNYELQKSSFSTYSYNPRNLGFAGGTYATRNYFLWYGLSDDYNIERYEFARGPNGTVFGDTNLGGIPTTWSKRASFGRVKTTAQTRVDTYGGWRASLDHNQPLTERFAVRVNLMHDGRQDWYDVARNNTHGLALASTYRLGKDDELRVDGETGQYFHQYYSHTNVDQGSFWDRTTRYNGVTAPVTTGTGVARNGAGLVYIPGVNAANGGLNDMSGFYTSQGSGLVIWPTARPDIAQPNYPTLPKRDFSLSPKDHTSNLHWWTWSVTWDHRFSDTFTTEMAFNRSEAHRFNGKAGSGNIYKNYRIDVNTVLPGGAPNPNFGKAYDDQQIAEQENENNVTQANALANWSLGTGWIKQNFAGLIGTRLDRFSVHQDRLVRTNNPLGGNLGLGNSANFVAVRRYWDQAGLELGDSPVPSNIPGYTLGWVPQSAQYQRKALDFVQLASISRLLKDRLTIMAGVRYDKVTDAQNNTSGIAADATSGLPVLGAVLPSPTNPNQTIGVPGVKIRTRNKATSSNGGFVYFFTPGLGVFANYAESIKASVAGSAFLDGTVPPNPHNSGRDYGLRLNLLDGRVSGSLGYYTNRQKGNIISNTTTNVTEINRLWTNIGRGDRANLGTYTDTQDIEGQGWEVELTTNPTRQVRLMWNLALPRSTTQSIRPQLAKYYQANRAAWQAGADDPANPQRVQIQNDLTAIANTQLAQTPGTPTNDTYRYTTNVYATYTFDSGWLKNFSLGGGANVRGRNKVGSLSTDPYTFLYAKGYTLVSANASYRYRFGPKLNVRFQLNITNLLNNRDPILSSQDSSGFTTYRVNNAGPTLQVKNAFRELDPRKVTFATTFEF
jgi:outer membrane receptor protein involved in Fe transport